MKERSVFEAIITQYAEAVGNVFVILEDLFALLVAKFRRSADED